MTKNPITVNAFRLLEIMVENGGRRYPNKSFGGKWLQAQSGLERIDFIDALNYLENLGAAGIHTVLGFGYLGIFDVFLYSKGRFLLAEYQAARQGPSEGPNSAPPRQPFSPVGSPYGFMEDDWQTVARQKQDHRTIYVVLGLQFQSEHYDTEALRRNVGLLFQEAVQAANEAVPEDRRVALHFEALSAGLGEHLFNRIARSVIGADVAVFETSDLNPNVMLEMGVALTWGVTVLPIRRRGQPAPPSDISGQTWIEYEESAAQVLSDRFIRHLAELVRVCADRKHFPRPEDPPASTLDNSGDPK